MLRTLLVTLLAASSTLAASGKAITYSVDKTQYEGYHISPSKNAPLVLMVHDWDGLTEYEKTRAGMLADSGYAVFALDLFGTGARAETMEERRALTGALYADRAKMRAVLNGGLAAAKAQGANTDNAVAMGYCFGGTAVLEWARSGADLKAFVPFHGGLNIPEDQSYADTKGQILVFHGTADESISMEDFAKLAAALEKDSVMHEMITYGGAPHAFTVFGSDRYRKEADERSWERFTRFLRETLRR
jgi:dienelactone hydrolase